MASLRAVCLVAVLCAACAPTTGVQQDTGLADAVTPPADDLGSEPDVVEPPPADEGVDAPVPGEDAAPDAAVTDAPDPFADAGALGPPATVPVTVMTRGTCPAVTPCGGAIAGTWDVAALCVEVPIADAVALCPGAMITRADGQARGRVIFGTSPMIARRTAQANVQVDLSIPALCARAAGGCDALQANFRMSVPDTTCTANAVGVCNCTSRVSSTIDDGDVYATRDNDIVSVTSGKRWGYCVAGNDLRYVDRSASGPREPGVVTLRRRE